MLSLSDRKDHTASVAHWVVPRSHGLETWGDAKTVDGRVSITQPLLTPMGESLSEIEVLTRLAGAPAKPVDFVRQTWPALADERAWRKALHYGLLEGESANGAVSFDRSVLASLLKSDPPAASLELCLDADPSLHDGRYANHAWLQETPNPVSKHTWGNALWAEPGRAVKYSVKNGDVVSVGASSMKSSIEAPFGSPRARRMTP